MATTTTTNETAAQEIELKRRCNLRVMHAETRRDALLGMFSSSLIRIPKRIQEMNVREFAENFKGSVQLVIDHERKRTQGTLLSGEAATVRRD
jgi:hypothetical protein